MEIVNDSLLIPSDSKPSGASSPSNRRHSCSTYLQDYASSQFQKPIKILARSFTHEASESRPPTRIQQQLPLIDLKIVDLYVKKGRHSSESSPGPVISKRSSSNEAPSGSTTSETTLCPEACNKRPGRLPELHGDVSRNLRIPAPKLHESSSDSNLRRVCSRHDDRSPTEASCFRILESLYVADAASASDDALMQKLKIDHLIDLRKRTAIQKGPYALAGQNVRTGCAVSPHLSADTRKVLTIALEQGASNANLGNRFQQIDAFITKARIRGKNVLLYDDDGQHEAAAAAIQYLMHYYRMRYSEAKQFVWQIIPKMEVPAMLELALQASVESSSGKMPKGGHESKAPSEWVHCRNIFKEVPHKKHLAWA